MVCSPQTSTLLLRSAREHFDHTPILSLRKRTALGDAHQSPSCTGFSSCACTLVERRTICRTADAAPDAREAPSRFGYLVADDTTFDQAGLVCSFITVLARFLEVFSPISILTCADPRLTRLKWRLLRCPEPSACVELVAQLDELLGQVRADWYEVL
jgi:hypothetical protein